MVMPEATSNRTASKKKKAERFIENMPFKAWITGGTNFCKPNRLSPGWCHSLKSLILQPSHGATAVSAKFMIRSIGIMNPSCYASLLTARAAQLMIQTRMSVTRNLGAMCCCTCCCCACVRAGAGRLLT